jgi:adenine deaminase
MSKPELRSLISAARGDEVVDLLLRNAKLVNVHLGEIIETDIAVTRGRVVGFGAYPARETIDVDGRFVAPGFIDAHVHIESAMVMPAEFARAVLPHGTTAVVADPHEIANVMGAAGIAYMLDAGRDQPVSFFYTLPSCVPATSLESSGAELTAKDLAPFIDHELVIGLAEMMNFPGVVQADPQIMDKLAMAAEAGIRCDGHAPGLHGQALNAYLAAGISSDHECTTAAEARAKLAGGMYIMVRQGTGARNLDDLLPAITPATSHRMMWCTDDRHPHDLMDIGHIDSMVRRAIKKGLDPITAIRMATLNPAQYFGLKEMGVLAPGRRAHCVVFDDLSDLKIKQVYAGGQLVAQEGRLIGSAAQRPDHGNGPQKSVVNTVVIDTDDPDLSVPAGGSLMRLMEVVPGQIVTRSRTTAPTLRDGLAVSDPSRDIIKMVVLERHRGTGRKGIGFIRGFGLLNGALASTVAHDSHNIVALGVDDRDIMVAVQSLADMGGGLVTANQGRITARLPLPIAGLMCDQPLASVRRHLDNLSAAAAELGVGLPDPFMILSFMALPVIPELKLTDHGLVDVGKFEIVPLFVD